MNQIFLFGANSQAADLTLISTSASSYSTNCTTCPAQLISATKSNFSCIVTMSLACLVCHGMSSPSHSFRSYSVSSSEEENRCGAVVTCLTRRVMPAGTANSVGTSKVTPFPLMATGQGTEGAPRLQRSRAVSRDLVRDWNFEEIAVGN
ncbi:hypothetical protein E2562_029169 [Oryza meyeriana var. granulata]|uniref:Uncharacterized protein n=1 Tax=Oryza meyeriana var. granulata TaxID=110450 RepID=A0A6G1E3H3_9ORYZ|nr:hypothetical protein E2562_029169 [Oryza meyeriana var. granulata]